MAQEQNTTVEVQPNDTIESLLQRLVAAGARNVNLVIPPGAQVPATLPEFEQLRELERKAGLRLTLVVDPCDRTRFGLAKILSFNVRTSDAAPPADTELTLPPPLAESSSPAATTPSSRISTTFTSPFASDLPPDIAGMNFDDEDISAPPTPSRSRILGADTAETRPTPPPRDRRAERTRPTPPADSTPVSSSPTPTGKIKIKVKTSAGSSTPPAEQPAPPVAPPSRRQPRYTAEVPPRAARPASDEPSITPVASYPTTTTGKIKIKAKTLGNPAAIVGSDVATPTPEQSATPPLTFADTEPIIAGDTGLGIPAARRPRREPPATPATEATTTATASVASPTGANTMKVKVKTKNGEWAADDTAATAAPSVAASPRPAGQSKTAAGAIALTPPRTISGTGRPPRTDAETLRRQRERSRLVIFAIPIILLLLGIGVGGYFLLSALNSGTPPSARVTLIPRTISLSQQVSVPINVSGQALLVRPVQADFRASPSSRLFVPTLLTDTVTLTNTNPTTGTLPPLPDHTTAPPVTAQVISITVSQTGTITTTGARQEPRGNDVTQLKIVNPNTFAVTIAANTRIPGGGTQFYFPEAVTVPASNLLANFIGTSYVDVTAVAVGPTGAAAYSMVGTVSSLQYQNTNKASGATIVDIPTVSEADYNNLVGGLLAKANALVPDQIAAQAGTRVLITQTITTDGDPQISADHKVGDDATSLSATIIRSGHAFAFNPQDASQAATAALLQSITSAASNVKLDPSSVKVQDGQLQQNGDNSYVYQASASATATYVIDQATMTGVRDLLAGHQATDSPTALRQSILARYPILADAQVQLTPGTGQNNGVLPSDKITVTTNSSGTSSTTPAAAPTP